MEECQADHIGVEILIGRNATLSLVMRNIVKTLILIMVPAMFSGMNTQTTQAAIPECGVADTLLTTDFIKNPNGDAYDYIRELALALGVNEFDLFSLIYFETGGTMDAGIRNPYSSAGGVLQFTDATARTLRHIDGSKYKSTNDLLNRCPDMECQLAIPGKKTKYGGPAFQYLSRFNIQNRYDMYMAVFYPYAIGKGPNFILPKSVQGINNGIHSVEEYVRRVDEQISALQTSN